MAGQWLARSVISQPLFDSLLLFYDSLSLFPPALIAVPFFCPWIVLRKSWLQGPQHSCRTIAPIANSQLKVTLCYLNSIFLQELGSIFFGKEILSLVSVKGNSMLSWSMAYFGRWTCPFHASSLFFVIAIEYNLKFYV